MTDSLFVEHICCETLFSFTATFAMVTNAYEDVSPRDIVGTIKCAFYSRAVCKILFRRGFENLGRGELKAEA